VSDELAILNRFPVPAFGLLCPVCRHGLDGLPNDLCPECGERFDLGSLVGPALEHNHPARREAIRILSAQLDPSCPVGEDLLAFFASSDQYAVVQAAEVAVRVARQRQAAALGGTDEAAEEADWEARASSVQPGTPFFSGFELPVPDFGLVCAGCKYPLQGLSRHVCPECGREFNPEKVLGEEPTLQVCLIHSEVEHAAAVSVLELRGIPNMLESPDPIAQTFSMSLGRKRQVGRLMVPREFYFDAIFWLRNSANSACDERDGCEKDSLSEAEETEDWHCSQCDESVPAEFTMCWNCCAARES
jgi:predicted amidophosphoribosyltransferase